MEDLLHVVAVELRLEDLVTVDDAVGRFDLVGRADGARR